ncbi:MAG: rod shape-determining protein MreC [Acidimicrobiales bacterium]|nr:rod shape-determining protein MreC [Acidimicrobiales bacterium]
MVLISVTVITLAYRGPVQRYVAKIQNATADALSPLQKDVSSALSPVGNIISGSIHYRQALQDNQELRDEIAKLKAEHLSDANLAQRLQELSALENIPFVGSLQTITAQVVDIGPSNFESTMTLDQGSHSGVAVGMPVVSNDGLVGRVISTSAFTSSVLLINDPTSNIAVEINHPINTLPTTTSTTTASSSTTTTISSPNQTTTTTTPLPTTSLAPPTLAIASGEGNGHDLVLSLVPNGVEIKQNDIVTTATLQGGIFPAGIPIGLVSNDSQKAAALQQSITVRPLANLNSIDYVSVIEWLPPT